MSHRRPLLALRRVALALLLPLAAHAATPTPDFSGVWMPVGTPPALRAEPGARKPPLLPEADRLYAERAALKGPARRAADPVARCLPPGVPRIFLQNAPFEVLQENGALTVLFQWNHRIRVIELGQSHDRLPMPGGAYDGYPVGRFAGDQLLVDTIGFNDATWLDEQGLPHGNQLHVTERWSLEESGQRLNIAFEVTDTATYSEPWQFSLAFRRLPRTTALEEDVCVERQGLVTGVAAPAAAPARAPARPATRKAVPAPPPATTRR
jgi:hypothetical protein